METGNSSGGLKIAIPSLAQRTVMAFLKTKKTYKLPFSLFVSPNVIFSPPHKKSWSFPDRPHAWTSPLFAFTFLHGKTSPGRKGKGKAEKSIKTPPPPRRGKSPEAAAKATKAQRTGRPPSDRGGFPPWDIRTERKKGGFKGGLFPLSLLQRKKKKKGKCCFLEREEEEGAGRCMRMDWGKWVSLFFLLVRLF